ncbi:MAG: glycosyltransferase [Anaerolineales bacterium]|nr:glycosyltransferase [Anaerolineales bacterium]
MLAMMESITRKSNSKNWIVIPTYWTSGTKTGGFDHPTPVDGRSTLPRLLDSMVNQKEKDFRVLILAGGVDESVLPLASETVDQIIQEYQDQLQINNCDYAILNKVREQYHLPERAFNLLTYAGIRNLQLLIPNMANAKIVIALDDDEVIAPNYVHQALKAIKTERIFGIAGPYENKNGELDLVEGEETGNIFLDKSRIMNAGLRQLIENPVKILPSPQVFGGNMIFHRDLFTQVGFDPGITRGEDMDYMLNSYLAGFTWYMDSDLRITHLPPKQHDAPQYAKLIQDVMRFFYERAKVQKYQVDPRLFDPYPGRFLYPDLDKHALQALQKYSTSEMISEYDSPEDIVAHDYSRVEQELPSYDEFRIQWPKWMEDTRENISLFT